MKFDRLILCCSGLIIALVAWVCLCRPAVGAEATEGSLNVVVLYSGDLFVPAAITQSQAMREAFTSGTTSSVNFYVETLHSQNLSQVDFDSDFVAFVQHKYRDQKINLLVVVGTEALNFLERNRPGLWPETPVMFYGVGEAMIRDRKFSEGVTGLTLDIDPAGTLDLAVRLQPEARRVVVVTGVSEVDRSWVPIIQRLLKDRHPNLSATFLTNQTVSELAEELRALPADAFVLYISVLEDAAGKRFVARDVAARLSAVSGAPFYGLYETLLGYGVVGGLMPSLDEHGRRAGELGLRIIAGENPGTIPVQPSAPAVPQVDWRQLQRWKISESRLPPGSIIRFRRPTVWENHKDYVIGGLCVMAVQAATIAVLLAQRARRRRAEAMLLEDEKRMALAVSAASLGIWMFDIASNQLWLNEQGRSLLGFTPSEKVDVAQMRSRLHPEDRETALAAREKSLSTRSEYEIDYRIVRPDKQIRWFHGRGRVELNAHGHPARLHGVFFDITDRKQGEEALRESEVRFRTMADTAPVLIWMSGTDKLCNFFNKGWLDFTGRALDAELGNGWADGVHPGDRPRCFEIYANSFDARQPFTMEYRLRRNDGEYRWLVDNGTPRFARDGAFLGYIGSCFDITQRKAGEEKFRVAVEASPVGLVLVDEQGGIVLANTQTENLFGYARKELIGQPVEILVPERLRAKHPGHRAGFLAAPSARAMGAGCDLFARRKDGTEFPVEIGISPIKTEEGTLILSVIVDMSARKQADLDAQRHRMEMTHLGRVALMGEMSASLAHELNQPLTAILNNVWTAQHSIDDGPFDRAELRELLADISADGRRASDVVRGIRSMVKKDAIVRQKMNLNEVVEDVVRIVHPDALLRSCEATTSLAADLPLIEGDPIQLRQVLLNLVINGFDAMRDTPLGNRRVEISTKSNGNHAIHVEVRDHGRGIPEKTRARLFDPFFTTKADGLGMGLAIVRSIVEAHGGTVAAENVKDGGARFRFTLAVNPSA